MAHITLVIMLTPPDHVISDPKKAASRHRRGDIFDVQRSSDIAVFDGSDWHVPDIGTKVFGYIHLRNVPQARARRMRDVLATDADERNERSEYVTINPGTGEEEIRTYPDAWRKARFRIPRSVIPAAAKAKLLADREITVQWSTFRGHIRKKIVANRLDPSSDDESNAVSDSDLM